MKSLQAPLSVALLVLLWASAACAVQLTGRVVDATQQPVAKIRVLLTQINPLPPRTPVVTDAVTDDQGRYTFPSAQQWESHIRAVSVVDARVTQRSEPGLGVPVSAGQSAVQDLVVAPGMLLRVAVATQPTAALSGTVRFARTSVPFAGTEIILDNLPQGLNQIGIVTTVASVTFTADLAPGVPLDTTVTLTPAARVTGTVVGTDGRPIEGVRYGPPQQRGGGTGAGTGYTNARGGFEMARSETGATDVAFQHQCCNDTTVRVAVAALSKPVKVTLTPKGSAITGRVDNAAGLGAPCYVRTQLQRRQQGGGGGGGRAAAQSVAVARDGSFSVAVDPQTRHRVSVECDGYRSTVDTVDAGADMGVISLEHSTIISGTVVSADDRRPVPLFRAGVLGAGPAQWRTVQDAQGRFTLEAPFAGPNIVYADAEGFVRGFDTVACQAHCDKLADIQLERCNRVSITVTDPDRNPLPRVRVLLMEEGANRRGGPPTFEITDSTGVATFACVKSGSFTVTVQGDTLGQAQEALTVRGDTRRTIELSPGAMVSGAVYDINGVPARDVLVQAEQQGAWGGGGGRGGRRGGPGRNMRPLTEGRFAVPVNDTGMVSIVISSVPTGGGRGMIELFRVDDVQPGARDLIIRLPEPRRWVIVPLKGGKPYREQLALQVQCTSDTTRRGGGRFGGGPGGQAYRPGDTLDVFAGQTYSINASGTGVAARRLFVTIPSGRGAYVSELLLDDIPTLQGTVVFPDSKPVGRGWAVSAGGQGRRTPSSTTDGRGHFALDGVSPGLVLVTVRDSSGALRYCGYVAAQPTEITLRLPKPGRVRGTTVDASGRAISGVDIVGIAAARDPGSVLSRASAKPNGTWGPMVLPPGEYLAACQGATRRVTIESDSVAPCRIAQAADLCRVEVKSGNQDDRAPRGTTLTEVDGRASFALGRRRGGRGGQTRDVPLLEGVPKGTYLVSRDPGRGSRDNTTQVALDTVLIDKALTPVTPRPARSAVEIRIVDSSGTPQDGGTVHVWQLPGPSSTPLTMASVDGSGVCGVLGLRVGSYSLTVTGSGVASVPQTLAISSDTLDTLVRLVGSAGGALTASLRGWVDRGDSWSVWLLDSLDRTVSLQPLVREGAVDFGAVPSGRYRVTAILSGTQVATAAVAVTRGKASTAELSMEPAGWIECIGPAQRVRGLSLQDGGGRRVPILSTVQLDNAYYAPDEQPSVTIAGLKPGSYSLWQQGAKIATATVAAGVLTRAVVR